MTWRLIQETLGTNSAWTCKKGTLPAAWQKLYHGSYHRPIAALCPAGSCIGEACHTHPLASSTTRNIILEMQYILGIHCAEAHVKSSRRHVLLHIKAHDPKCSPSNRNKNHYQAVAVHLVHLNGSLASCCLFWCLLKQPYHPTCTEHGTELMIDPLHWLIMPAPKPVNRTLCSHQHHTTLFISHMDLHALVL